jgi:hypothetical protein
MVQKPLIATGQFGPDPWQLLTNGRPALTRSRPERWKLDTTTLHHNMHVQDSYNAGIMHAIVTQVASKIMILLVIDDT